MILTKFPTRLATPKSRKARKQSSKNNIKDYSIEQRATCLELKWLSGTSQSVTTCTQPRIVFLKVWKMADGWDFGFAIMIKSLLYVMILSQFFLFKPFESSGHHIMKKKQPAGTDVKTWHWCMFPHRIRPHSHWCRHTLLSQGYTTRSRISLHQPHILFRLKRYSSNKTMNNLVYPKLQYRFVINWPGRTTQSISSELSPQWL